MKKYSKVDWDRISGEWERVYELFETAMEKGSDDISAVEAAGEWQMLITNNFYDCTDEMLKDLGELYLADARFLKNIDKRKEGLAAFIKTSIDSYIESKKL